MHLNDKSVEGTLKYGELLLLDAPYESFDVSITTKNNFTINGNKDFNSKVYGGEVGILLDGRGRPFKFDIDLENRIKKISEWSKKTNEYPR